MLSICSVLLWSRLIPLSGFQKNETSDSNSIDIICLNVFMGYYPVKCYLLICRETRATAIIDTEANTEAIIKKLVSLGVKPEKTLLTHTHPDYAGG